MVRAASLILLMVLGACAGSPSPQSDGATIGQSSTSAAPPPPSPSETVEWVEPAAYAFTLESGCGERMLIGRFHIDVENGEVIAIEGLDEPGRRAAAALEPAAVPTLADLNRLVADAREHGADKATLIADPVDGHPVSVDIDWQANAEDDEECYEVSEFVPRANASFGGDLYLPIYGPMSSVPEALLEGALVDDDGCLWVEFPGGRALALWPTGSTIERHNGTTSVLNSGGSRAEVGTRIIGGGGEYGPDSYDFVVDLIGEDVPNACRGENVYWLLYDVHTNQEMGQVGARAVAASH